MVKDCARCFCFRWVSWSSKTWAFACLTTYDRTSSYPGSVLGSRWRIFQDTAAKVSSPLASKRCIIGMNRYHLWVPSVALCTYPTVCTVAPIRIHILTSSRLRQELRGSGEPRPAPVRDLRGIVVGNECEGLFRTGLGAELWLGAVVVWGSESTF